MTLMELMVSLAVLAVITVAFGTIMTQSQKVVEKSNALMQANATASAVAQVLRNDLACFSSQGFLAVYDPSDPNDPNQRCLVFTAVGPFTSKTDPTITANAARIDYGLDPNKTLWRRAVLLSAVDTGGGSANEDTDPNVWLGRYDPNSPSPIDLSSEVSNYCALPDIPVEPNTPSRVNQLWPLLARPCTKFEVAWWNGSNWVYTPTTWTAGSSPPSAIKVNFALKTGPKNQDYLDYEVICPIRP